MDHPPSAHTSTNPWTLPLASPEATLAAVGGKGTNLARLARAGFPVPPGFLLTTAAYQAFVERNRLGAWITELSQAARPDDPASLERASVAIRHLFTAGQVPPEIAAALGQAYAALADDEPSAPLAVAVRSSATAEDLPELSFAGQQETYLNVIGPAALLEAVVKCWGSLWTARAIGYRARNRLSPQGVALAVVVQVMVPSEAAGVLFTADPLTGRRTHSVLDATLGLGEALVSGQVVPDHYVVETATGRLLSKTLGAKAVAIHGRAEGGVETVAVNAADRQALPDDAITALAALGGRVAAEMGAAQDIEWAWAGGTLTLLQARPITALFPVPGGVPAEPLRVFFSFGAVQGLLDPLTPLGQATLQQVVVGVAKLLGYRLDEAKSPFQLAGERLWVDISGPLRNRLGRRAALGALSFVEPSVGQAVMTLLDDPRLALQSEGFSPRTLWHLAPRLAPVLGFVLRYFMDPDGRRASAIRETDSYLESLRRRCAVSGSPEAKLGQRVALLRAEAQTLPEAIPILITGLVAGMVSFNLLRLLIARHLPRDLVPDPDQLVLEATRGLPHNVTTTMDLRLWETARALRAVPEAAAYFQATPAGQLAADFLAGRLPAEAQAALQAFLDQYGARGLGEIDLGRARWREDPTPVVQALQSYLRIDAARAPDVVFQRGEAAGRAAAERLEQAARQAPGGWLRARLARFLARRMRSLMGLRESPKFFIIRLLGHLRQALLDSGRELAEAGRLAQAEDLFFLRLDELEALARGEARDWRGLVLERQAICERERQRRQVPRLLLSDGQAIYAGLGAAQTTEAGVLAGDPVSPGVAEGLARIVLDPHHAELEPGEIMVCPGTDPSWTPLFLAAGGLITEVGGLMTHGSVVAREYGIPAVVGVDRATQRLHTGQRLRLDGATGRIEILD